MAPGSTALLIAIIALAIGVIGIASPASPAIAKHPRFTVQFNIPEDMSKFSLDADINVVAAGLSTIARQGQFPASVNLFVYYVWCDTTVTGGNLILQQTGGAGWKYTFACGNGQSSSGNPGFSSALFSQALGANNNYDIVEQNTNIVGDTMQGGFVVSTTNAFSSSQLSSASTFTQNILQITVGQSIHVYYETGFAASCASGTLVCYIGFNPTVLGSSCKLDLSGGTIFQSGDPEALTAICTITATDTIHNAYSAVLFNGDTVPRSIGGLFVISIF